MGLPLDPSKYQSEAFFQPGDFIGYIRDLGRLGDRPAPEAVILSYQRSVLEYVEASRKVKPAGGYLDVLREVADSVDVPVAAYQVSGEYAMVEAAAANGWIDRDRMVVESVTSIHRAGADIVHTYWAAELGRWIAEGKA